MKTKMKGNAMKPRKIKNIIKAMTVNMGGFIVDQPLPAIDTDMIDPFLLIHHADPNYRSGRHERELGVGPHPHRGFSPITFVFQGEVHHRDSLGNTSIVKAGGTQWMNSGRGIVHSERPSKKLATEGGTMEIIQFWVNTPAAHKMKPPGYFALSKENTPVKVLDDGKSEIYVVCGNFGGLEGPARSFSPLLIQRLNLKQGAETFIPLPEDFNALIYQLDGELFFNDTKVSARHLTWFEQSDDGIALRAEEDTRAILLSGKPIGEKVVSHGPFIMNSKSEILRAFDDYQKGRMGVLIEEFA